MPHKINVMSLPLLNMHFQIQGRRNRVGQGGRARDAIALPDFGRAENGGGSAGTPQYYLPPHIFTPSAIPELFKRSFLLLNLPFHAKVHISMK